ELVGHCRAGREDQHGSDDQSAQSRGHPQPAGSLERSDRSRVLHLLVPPCKGAKPDPGAFTVSRPFGSCGAPAERCRRSAGAFMGALNQLRSDRPDFWILVAYRDLHIEVRGDRAVVTYVITYNGAPIERATADNPDLYTRASKTVYGRTVSVKEQLQNLENAH